MKKQLSSNHIFPDDFNHQVPIIGRGNGIYLYDIDGNEIIDGCSGALVTCIGHGVTEVADAMYKQACKIGYVHRHQFINEPALKLAEMLVQLAPEDMDRVYYVSGGSEATEAALKMARQYQVQRGEISRYKVIGRWPGYHGNSIGSLSMSGHYGRRKNSDPILLKFPHIPAPYCYRCPYGLTHPECRLVCARALELQIQQEDPSTVAAFIAEPIVGASVAALVPPEGYMAAIREICDRYNILFIADEVMTGIGRTGMNFAVNHWNVTPDIICVAKGVTGGYSPLGGLIVHKKVAQAFQKGNGKFIHGHTYAANPVSCAVGVAVLSIVQRDQLIAHAAEVGKYLFDQLSDLSDLPYIGEIRGKGLMVGIELVKDKQTKQTFDPALGVTKRLSENALKEGLQVYPSSGFVDNAGGDGIILAPPLIVSRSEIDEILRRLTRAMEKTYREIKN